MIRFVAVVVAVLAGVWTIGGEIVAQDNGGRFLTDFRSLEGFHVESAVDAWNARLNANEFVVERARSAHRKAVASLKGKDVRWRFPISGVDKDGLIYPQTMLVLTAKDKDGERVPITIDAVFMIAENKAKMPDKLKAGDTVTLAGTIADAELAESVGGHLFNLKLKLKNVRVVD